jgi:hypothetical protein
MDLRKLACQQIQLDAKEVCRRGIRTSCTFSGGFNAAMLDGLSRLFTFILHLVTFVASGSVFQ